LTSAGESAKNAGRGIVGAFQSAGASIVSGFQAGAGAMAAFSGSSDEAIQAMAQLQGIMAMREGIAGLVQATGISRLLTSALTKGSAAAKVLKVALISTGVGALIVAVGSLIAYFSKFEEGIDLAQRGIAQL
jgi:hypothetical protein